MLNNLVVVVSLYFLNTVLESIKACSVLQAGQSGRGSSSEEKKNPLHNSIRQQVGGEGLTSEVQGSCALLRPEPQLHPCSFLCSKNRNLWKY